jgi:RPA family protein
VLIALWNGEYSGRRGGTGEVVKEALNAGKPVYWIYADNLQDGALNSLKELKKSGEIQVLGKNRDFKIDKFPPV